MTKRTLARAADPAQRLLLASNLQPDVDTVLAEGLAAFGIKGSGKSNLVALLIEQLRRFFLPQVILDTEREYHDLLNILPHGVLATAHHCPTGDNILHQGLQVVVDLPSWDSVEGAALAICQLVQELFAAAAQMNHADLVPCVIHLDEAGYWLPQQAASHLGRDTRRSLLDAFTLLATRGRKYGLTPFYYTQYISQIHKDVVRQSGILVLMRQMQDIDLRRYGEYLALDALRRAAIRAFPAGKAVVCLPDGAQPVVQFYLRETVHPSHTPKARAAVVKFAHTAPDREAISTYAKEAHYD
jgi:hypothetical protein